MPFQIIRNDITKVKADAIVNTANPSVAIGSGVDSAIYKAAGEEKLLAERKKIGWLKPGDLAITPAFDLDAKYIIHVSGPWWEGGDKGEVDLLRKCYDDALKIAANISKQYFSKLLKGQVKPSKEKVLALAVGLRLNLDEAEDFLRLAGYAFSPISQTDAVVVFFLKKKEYNVSMIDIVLFDYGLDTLSKE